MTLTVQTTESMAVVGAGVGMADTQRSSGAGGEGAGLSTGGEEIRSSTTVSGNVLMEAIDITTNGRRSLLSFSLSLPFSLSDLYISKLNEIYGYSSSSYFHTWIVVESSPYIPTRRMHVVYSLCRFEATADS